MKLPSHYRSKIYIKAIILLTMIAIAFTIAVSIFVVPKVDTAIENLENKNVHLLLSNTINIVNDRYKALDEFKVKALQKHKDILQNTTMVAWSILDTKYNQYKSTQNTIKKDQIKKDAIELVKNLRYQKDGYFWINDFKPKMIMHPFKPSLDGKDLSNFKDPNGVYLFNNMVKVVQSGGEGFVNYSWPKPNHSKPQPKISFVKSFPQWRWIIGTGTYIDNIDKEIAQRKSGILKELKQTIKDVTIGKSGYIFLFDKNGNILYHPNKYMYSHNIKSLINTITNESFYDYFVNVSKSKTKSSSYIWNKPSDKNNFIYKKVSWVEYLPNAEVYVCATAYEDELKETSTYISYMLTKYSMGRFVMISIFMLIFLGMILKPIIKLSELSKKVRNGNFDVKSDIKRDDEIGILSDAFNSMIDKISSQIHTLEDEVKQKTLTLVENSLGLEKIIDSTSILFQANSMEQFTKDVLTQLNSVLNIDNSNSYFCTFRDGEIVILAASGKFNDKNGNAIITPESFDCLNNVVISQKSFYDGDTYVGFFRSNDDFIFLYLEDCDKLSKTSKDLLEIFSTNITVAFNNINLNKEIIDTQKELLERLGEMVELKSEETAGHVKRVASISYILAVAYGIPKEDAFILKLASPMHDIGKLGIPDHILKKAGKLDEDEFKIMQTHPSLGREVFKNSEKKILKIASIVAYQHHEKWDGTGYPQGLKGENIDIYARITTVADVFDALTQKRVYKDPWSNEKVLKFFDENSGIHFDPKLVDLLHKNIEDISKFREDYVS